MSSLWRRTMLYLGLGPDEEYEDYETQPAPAAAEQPVAEAQPDPAVSQARRPPRSEPWRSPQSRIPSRR